MVHFSGIMQEDIISFPTNKFKRGFLSLLLSVLITICNTADLQTLPSASNLQSMLTAIDPQSVADTTSIHQSTPPSGM